MRTSGRVVLPILSKLDFEDYEKVIFYDLNFDKDNLSNFMENSKSLNIEFLLSKEDIKLNEKLLNIFTPTVDEMRFVYKTFISMKGKAFKIEPSSYLKFINKKTNEKMTKFKLNLILDIFKDLNFVEFINKDGFYFIKVLEDSNEKIDIIDTSKVKYLYSLNNFT